MMHVEQTRIERLFKSQERIRRLYHQGEIDAALNEFDSGIATEMHSINPRIRLFAARLAQSILRMSNDDLTAMGITPTDTGSVT